MFEPLSQGGSLPYSWFCDVTGFSSVLTTTITCAILPFPQALMLYDARAFLACCLVHHDKHGIDDMLAEDSPEYDDLTEENLSDNYNGEFQ